MSPFFPLWYVDTAEFDPDEPSSPVLLDLAASVTAEVASEAVSAEVERPC